MINLWNQLYLLSLFSFFLLLSLPIHIQYPCILHTRYLPKHQKRHYKNDVWRRQADVTYICTSMKQAFWLADRTGLLCVASFDWSKCNRTISARSSRIWSITSVQSPHLISTFWCSWYLIWELYLSEYSLVLLQIVLIILLLAQQSIHYNIWL